MIHSMTRRRALLAAGLAAALLWTPGRPAARPGADGTEGFLGWDDLSEALGRPVRIAGFLSHGPVPGTGDSILPALLPYLAPVPSPPGQRLTLVLPRDLRPPETSDILVLEVTGRIEARGNSYAMAPQVMRTLLRLQPSP